MQLGNLVLYLVCPVSVDFAQLFSRLNRFGFGAECSGTSGLPPTSARVHDRQAGWEAGLHYRLWPVCKTELKIDGPVRRDRGRLVSPAPFHSWEEPRVQNEIVDLTRFACSEASWDFRPNNNGFDFSGQPSSSSTSGGNWKSPPMIKGMLYARTKRATLSSKAEFRSLSPSPVNKYTVTINTPRFGPPPPHTR